MKLAAFAGEVVDGDLKIFNFILRSTPVLFIFLCSFLKEDANVLSVRRRMWGFA